MAYSYFISHPNELRHDVRDNFEEWLTGITDITGNAGKPDERPITEQAADMMDQLALMEQMMGTSMFGESGGRPEPDPAPAPATPKPSPHYPTFEVD